MGDREVGRHLMSNAGFLDKTWFDRNFWTFSRRWPGFYFGYDAPKVGQILVFDDETTYGLHVFNTRQSLSPRFWPGTDGYELFADANTNRPVLRPTAIGREKGLGFSRTLPPKWSVRIPVRAQAMVLSGEHLYLAGPPDVVPQDVMMNPEWNSDDPRASLLAEWEFLHEHARQLFLKDGTHVEILFILADGGTMQPVPQATRQAFTWTNLVDIRAQSDTLAHQSSDNCCLTSYSLANVLPLWALIALSATARVAELMLTASLGFGNL